MDNKMVDKIGVIYCICQCAFFEEAFGAKSATLIR